MKKTCVQIFIFVVVSVVFGAAESAVSAKNKFPLKLDSKRILKREKISRMKASVDDKIQTLPLLFEENQGQFGKNIKFLSRVKNFNLALNSNEVMYQMPDPNCETNRQDSIKRNLKPCKTFLLKMKIINANSDTVIEGFDKAVTRTNYSIGNDQTKWLNDISNYEGVRLQDIYQGINLVFRGTEQELEYDFHLAPNADANLIRLKFDGAKNFQINEVGELVFKFKGIELKHRKPFAYQIVNGEKVPVNVGYVLLDKKRIGFKLGDYDRTKELIIDPVVYASYLGGTAGGDVIDDIAVDRQGNIYTASDARFDVGGGYTYSNVMISKFDITKPRAEQRLWVKFIGGSQDDVPYGMDIDDSGRVYVTGVTYSPDFPLNFAEQRTHPINRINYDFTGFVLQLGWNGEISYSTYLGGSTPSEYGESIVSDSNGNAYVTGYTCSTNFPTRNGFQNSLQGSCNAYLTKYDNFGHIIYSTLFGGTNSIGIDAFTDGNGIAYISGGTNNGIYTTSGAYSTTGSGFVAKFDTNQTGSNSLIYSTRIPKQGAAIAVDRSGNAWIAMSTLGFLTSQSAQVIRLNNAGSGLLVSSQTFGNQIRDIAVDGNGSAYFSYNFYANNNIATKVTALRPSGEEIDSYTIDATRDEQVFGITLGPESDMVYIGGHTTSFDFPVTGNPYQPTSNAPNIFFGQGFFAKVRLNIPQEREPLIFVPGIAGSTLYEADSNGYPITGGIYSEIWTNGIFNPTGNTLTKLFLTPPETNHPKIVAVDAVRSVAPFVNIYKPLLDELRKDYIEYEIEGNPKKRNTQCTGEEKYNGKKPNLFVFAYDWRQSNVNAATQLKQYVDCVQKFYPDKKVNILSHSMGGLVTRRYIIDHPNNHNIDKLITIVAPFLGAPKGIDALFTGRFIGKTFLKGIPIGAGAGIYIYQDTVKEMISYAKGAHQLLPSAWYFELGERPFGYKTPFLQLVTDYSFIESNDILNTKFASKPYDTANEYHNYQSASQDNWSFDSSGIKFYHIYGVQSWNTTPSKIVVAPYVAFPRSEEQRKYGVETEYSEGDGTVPALSAKRASFLIAPNTLVKRCESPSWFSDGSYEHNGLTTNPILWNEVRAILNDVTINQSQCAIEYSSLTSENTSNKAMSNQDVNLNNNIEINLLKIYGVDRIQITDEVGNTNTPVGIGVEQAVPEIDYESGSNSFDSFIFPHELTFAASKAADIKFTATSEKIRIELFKGISRQNSSEVTKYMDLQLPPGVVAWLKFTANHVENLRYDADSDGIFETEVQPTFHLTGASANDRTPPNIDISFTVNNNTATVTVNATDRETGINQIRYIVDGETSDHIYSAPFNLDLTQSKLLYVSAEDTAGNRNLLAKWLDVSAPNTTAIQIPPSNLNGWSKEDVSVEIKSFDDLGGSGIESLTYGGSGTQTFPEEMLSVKDIPFTFPSPNMASDFVAKSLAVNLEGITNLSFFAKDKAGNMETTKTVAVKIDKTAPETTGSYMQNESQMIVTLNSNDALSGVDHTSYFLDGGSLQTYTAPLTVSGSGNHTIAFFATDKAGNVEEIKTLSFTIVIVNPDVVIISPSSGAVYPVGTTVNFAGNFSGDICNSHIATWTFDNISQTGAVNESNGTVTTNYTFASAGVYFVSLWVNNNCGGTGSTNTVDGLTAMIVVYDPDGGFVTGGGWFDSPLGAYTPNPSLTGRASFGFNSKYQRGANVPTGNTEFQFRVADFNFKSTSYDWLVVGGAKAQFKGSGTINGSGSYGFMLTAIDGQINSSGGQDKFRIKIWDKTTSNVIYDNQLGSSDSENPTTAIGGGSIIIHRQ